MKIGKLYRLTDKAKQDIITKGNGLISLDRINVYKPAPQSHQTYDLGIYIVPLEFHYTTLYGGALKGKYTLRVYALFPDGTTGFVYVSTHDWEEVK